MYRALTAQQARAVEAHAVAESGTSLAELMNRAGSAVASQVALMAAGGTILIVCGPGNNGGDGWIAARELHAAGQSVLVYTVRALDELHGLSAEAARSALDAGVAWEYPQYPVADDVLSDATVIVDALLGTGSALPLRGLIGEWCSAINRSGALVVSVDVPTGVDSDTGRCDSEAIFADATVTFTAPKLGLVQYPGAERAGEIVVANLGIDRAFADVPDAPQIWTAEEYAALLPRPSADAHKNERGRVLIVAGSRSFPGAAVLAARGAMRMGAGYVTLAIPAPMVPIAQAHLLAAPVVGLPTAGRALSSAAAAVVKAMAPDYDAVVLGPGLTVADGAAATARSLVATLEQPVVIDADGLNAFVDHLDAIEARTAPTVLTPHPGELARLLGTSAEEVQADRLASSTRLATDQRAVVLKGAGTVTSGQRQVIVNTSGTSALATAGTGDVLAGMIGALLAQGLSPLQAGALGAYVHGRAGEAAASQLTPLCVTAEDVPEFVPVAVSELLRSW